MRSKAEVGENKQGSASRSRLIFLVGTPGDDLHRVIRQRAFGVPAPHPMARASRRHAPRPSSGSPAWLWDGSVRPPRSARSSGNRTRDAAQESASTWFMLRIVVFSL